MHVMPTTLHFRHHWRCSNVNVADAQTLLTQYVNKPKLMTIGGVPVDITIRADNDPVENGRNIKYRGSHKPSPCDCAKYVNVRITMAKRIMYELTTLWKHRSSPVALKMRLAKTLVVTGSSYGADAWTPRIRDERNIASMDMWLWRRMKRISWMKKDRKRKLSYFGHLCRDHGHQITKTVVEGAWEEGEDAEGHGNSTWTASSSGHK